MPPSVANSEPIRCRTCEDVTETLTLSFANPTTSVSRSTGADSNITVLTKLDPANDALAGAAGAVALNERFDASRCSVSARVVAPQAGAVATVLPFRKTSTGG